MADHGNAVALLNRASQSTLVLGIADRVDSIIGHVNATVSGSSPSVLTFHWRSDANGDAEANIDWPIIGTLLHLRATPGKGSANAPTANYDVVILDETRAEDTDIMGELGFNLGIAAGTTQQEIPLSIQRTFGTEGVAYAERGIPCSVPSFTLKIFNAGATRSGVLKLFWQPS